ncbi:MAG: antitoxin [Actinomycetota bacterium]|nr:antitoxin [Actinomycetota bacterium]MDQ6946657.1 antitoxin [Actinomycetota bacterium]
MRTTITLDSDVEALVKEFMLRRGLSFKEAVNTAIRAGLAGPIKGEVYRTRTFAMGYEPRVPWDKALSLAADLEDDELIRKVAARK